MSTVHLVGVGPGDSALVTPQVREILQCVDCVVGWEQNYRPVDDLLPDHVDRFVQSVENYHEMLESVVDRAAQGNEVAVLKIGDPTVSSGLHRVTNLVATTPDVSLRVHPGISAVQLFAARVRIALHRSVVASFHDDDDRNQAEREFLLDAWHHDRHLILLSGPEFRPADAAKFFIDHQIPPDTKTVVGSQLSWSSEEIYQTTLSEIIDASFHWLSTMAVLNPAALPANHNWPDT